MALKAVKYLGGEDFRVLTSDDMAKVFDEDGIEIPADPPWEQTWSLEAGHVAFVPQERAKAIVTQIIGFRDATPEEVERAQTRLNTQAQDAVDEMYREARARGEVDDVDESNDDEGDDLEAPGES